MKGGGFTEGGHFKKKEILLDFSFLFFFFCDVLNKLYI